MNAVVPALDDQPPSAGGLHATEDASSGGLRRLLAHAAARHGFVGALYVHLGHGLADAGAGPAPASPLRILSTGAMDEDTYRQRNFAAIDPLAARAARSFAPFHWSLSELTAKAAARAPFATALAAWGIGSGVVAPAQDHACGPAFVNLFRTVATPAPDATASDQGALLLLAAQFHDAAKRLGGVATDRAGGLTAREMEVLRLAALGHGEQETAQMLALSRRGVQFHLARALQKLGAPNKTAAVAKAVGAGLIRV